MSRGRSWAIRGRVSLTQQNLADTFMSRSARSVFATAFAVASPRVLFFSGVGALACAFAAGAAPQADPSPAQTAASTASKELRICASAKQLPYSAKDGSGFENKIGEIVAKAMGREPVFVFADKPAIYLVRDWLDKNKCDVVVGLDAGDARVLTTKPYYRAAYVFVTQKDRGLAIQSWNDPKLKQLGHIVVDLGSPSETMLKQIGAYESDMAYLYSLVGFKAPRNEYVQISPERMIGEIKTGGADLAAAFAPDVARYVKGDSSLSMIPIRDDAKGAGGEKLPQQYDQAMGVRIGDAQLLSELDEALVRANAEIKAVLKDEGIPLVDASK
jgi:mxaJ protein